MAKPKAALEGVPSFQTKVPMRILFIPPLVILGANVLKYLHVMQYMVVPKWIKQIEHIWTGDLLSPSWAPERKKRLTQRLTTPSSGRGSSILLPVASGTAAKAQYGLSLIHI